MNIQLRKKKPTLEDGIASTKPDDKLIYMDCIGFLIAIAQTKLSQFVELLLKSVYFFWSSVKSFWEK